MAVWELEVGAEATRSALAVRYGGNRQAGIMASGRTPNVMVFTDPEKAAKNGYDFDGWVGSNLYQYTGDGQEGDQTWSTGNSRIRDHRVRGDAIRVFVANGVQSGTSQTKKHLYLGEFELDEQAPFVRAECPDKTGRNRSAIVFRLRPVGDTLRRSEDIAEQPLGTASDPIEIQELPLSVEDTMVQQQHSSSFDRNAVPEIEGKRREAALVLRYADFLTRNGHNVGAKRITGRGLAAPLEVDLFDRTANELVEAKSETTRDNIRYALGQVLDYARFIKPDTSAVLLPSLPSVELLELLTHNGVACIYETATGEFERVEAAKQTQM